jgi:hypothetical protein
MQIGRYNFHCTLQDEALLPPYKGSTFRGAFGTALKRAVCVARQQECTSCLLAERCIYACTFEAGKMPANSPDSKASAPPPYVIEPPLETRTAYPSGSPFNFSLLLFGETNASLPYFVYAFEIMGASGIGKRIKGQRARFTLEKVTSRGNVIYENSTRKLLPVPAVDAILHPDWQGPDCTAVSIQLLTPLRLKHNNTLSSRLPFDMLVRAMLRRISSIYEQYGDGEPAIDYRGLITEAAGVSTASSTLRWHDWERYSNRQEQAMMMGGLLGDVTYRGNITPYLPLLELCKELHIGKQSSFGLGMFDYRIITEEVS